MIRKSPLLAAALAATLLALVSCTSTNDHLVFFTNTTIGVDIGTGPESGGAPKFLIGYERLEGVVDPLQGGYEFIEAVGLTASEAAAINALREAGQGTTKSDGTDQLGGSSGSNAELAQILEDVIAVPGGFLVKSAVRDQAHSVLAKLNFGASSDAASAHNAQWFATGLAAIAMANNENIAAAVTGGTVGATAIETVAGTGQLTDLALLKTAAARIDKIAKDPQHPRQEDAAVVLAKVGVIDGAPYAAPFEEYTFITPNLTSTTWKPKASKGPLADAVKYLGLLSGSRTSLEDAIKAKDAGTAVVDPGKKMGTHFIEQHKLHSDLQAKLFAEPAIIEMMTLYKETL